MAGITFEPVTKNYDKIEAVRRIYEEAFPANEREKSIDALIKLGEATGIIGVNTAVEDNNVVGIVVVFEEEKHIYLQFLAVNSELRGGGYGTKIMNALMSYCGEKLLLFDIETPNPEAENNEQRIKRQRFYERVGCINTGISFDYGEDNYTFFSNRESDIIKEELKKHFMTCIGFAKKYDSVTAMQNADMAVAFIEKLFG